VRSEAQFEALARTASPRLLGYVTRRLGDPADAADVVAEVLLVAWRRIESLPHGDEEAVHWLFGVARRVLANVRRGRIRRHQLAERLRHELASVVPAEPAPNSGVLREILASLPEADRELITLQAWEGLTVAQAATVVGIRPAAARKRLERARRRIRTALDDADAEPARGGFGLSSEGA
jgi:RNA polymerase sigma-70 factor (ECF subfamily)